MEWERDDIGVLFYSNFYSGIEVDGLTRAVDNDSYSLYMLSLRNN